MTNTTNTADLRAALIEARDWFESQAKAVSKGCGSNYELHDLRVQRDALDAALAAPAQAAPGVQSDAAPCHCTNPWAHDQCTDSPGCKIKKKLTKASQPVATPAGMESLTDSQITAARRAYPAEDLCGWSYRMGIADAEKHHGITAAPKGVQHGTE